MRFTLAGVAVGLGLSLGLSCSAPPIRPMTHQAFDADPEFDPSADDVEGDAGEDSGSEMNSGEDTESEDLNAEAVPSVKPGDKVETKPSGDTSPSGTSVPPGTPTTPIEPKHSLLFVSGGSDKVDVYKFDKKTGSATLLKSNATGGPFNTFLAVHPKSKRAFASDEKNNQVIMYTIDPVTGSLSELDKRPTAGGPAHISVDSTGTQVFIANYGAGAVESFTVQGSKLGAASRKTPGAKAHAVHLDLTGKNLFVPCLGAGLIAHFKVGVTGILTEATPQSLAVGTKGPRHMAFHPNGKFVYLMNEYEGSVQALAFDGMQLSLLGTQVPSTASPVAGNTGAEIQVHPNGKFLYSSNRGDDSIAIYSVAESGTVTFKKAVKTGGRTPRHFALDSSGTWLTIANSSTDSVTIFEVDKVTGELKPKNAGLTFASPQYAEIFDFYD